MAKQLLSGYKILPRLLPFKLVLLILAYTNMLTAMATVKLDREDAPDYDEAQDVEYPDAGQPDFDEGPQTEYSEGFADAEDECSQEWRARSQK